MAWRGCSRRLAGGWGGGRDRLARPAPPLHRRRRPPPPRLPAPARAVPRPPRAHLRPRPPAARRARDLHGNRALALRARPPDRRPRAPRAPRRGRDAAPRLPAPGQGPRRAAGAPEGRRLQPDGHGEGPRGPPPPPRPPPVRLSRAGGP